MFNRKFLLLTLIVSLTAAMVGSIYDPYLKLFAQPKDHTVEILDRELKHIVEKFGSLQRQIKGIRDDIQDVCKQQTEMRVKMAESGAIYGGVAGLLIQLFGFLGRGIFKRNGKGKKF